MSVVRPGHLIERAVERMAELGNAAPVPSLPPPAAPTATAPPAASDAAGVPPISVASLEAAGLVVAIARRSRVAEEWRVTAGHLLRAMRADTSRAAAGSGARNMLMVTSSRPKEGKSFSALNLAASLSLGGLAEVLLVDVDSKPMAMSAVLGLGDRPGLFDLLTDPALRVDDLVVATAIPGLSILPIGGMAHDTGSTHRTITRPVVVTLERIARHYPDRVLVLDTAPCLATSDAATLAPAMGQVAMIVEADITQRDDLEAALEMLRTCPNITLILNKMQVASGHAFGNYYYHGT